MFRRKPAPQTLPQKTDIYQKRLHESLRIQTHGGRYQALALLLNDIQKDLKARDKQFTDAEDRRSATALISLAAGIPAVACAAAVVGPPAFLLIAPLFLLGGPYTNHKHHQAKNTYQSENTRCLPVIERIMHTAIGAQNDMLKHHADILAASPQHAQLLKTCPRLRAHFAAANENKPAQTNAPQAKNAPRPPR